MIEVCCVGEVGLHATSNTDLGIRLISWDSQLRTKNGNRKILDALVAKELLPVRRELDRAPDQLSTVRAPRSAGNGKQAPGLVG